MYTVMKTVNKKDRKVKILLSKYDKHSEEVEKFLDSVDEREVVLTVEVVEKLNDITILSDNEKIPVTSTFKKKEERKIKKLVIEKITEIIEKYKAQGYFNSKVYMVNNDISPVIRKDLSVPENQIIGVIKNNEKFSISTFDEMEANIHVLVNNSLKDLDIVNEDKDMLTTILIKLLIKSVVIMDESIERPPIVEYKENGNVYHIHANGEVLEYTKTGINKKYLDIPELAKHIYGLYKRCKMENN